MNNKILNLILIFTVGCSFSQNKDFKYFDKNWQETIKDKAFFYRIMPSKKIDNLVLIEDFYINKIPQFQGYSLESDENSHVGDIVWYDENGFDSSVYQYYNVSAPVLTYYYPNGKKLRTVEYKKGKKDGFTILYHQDGTVLMKGKYLEGKPVEGDFEDISTWDDYRRNESEVETDSTIDADPVVVSSVEVFTKDSPVEVATMPKKKTAKKIVKQKIFWINSKQVAQETWYDPENYRMYPYKQMNYDVNGKLLQSIDKSGFEEYGSRISNGIFYCYYLQNKFAVAIKSKTVYNHGQKSGEEIKYYPNGKIQEFTKYLDGKKVGDEVVYDKNETVMKKRTYKNGEPFEGNFNNHFLSGLIINENYVKGLKEGESIVKSDKDSIVAKGIYKNDKPYNGTFIVKIGEDDYELVHLVDFKKNGLQKVFKYNIDDVIKTYTCVNDVINGETIFYESGQVTGKLEYKNGLPYEGKLVKAESATIYKNGLITEEIFYMSNYESKDETNILKSKYYTNGKLSKIANRSFAIADDVKDSYEGIYKNEQPYSGYFSADFREFNYVDYYEKGEKKYQFSNNYLENLDNYKHPNYNIKSTYKDGKIIDGVEYIKFDRQFISKYWKNGVLQAFDCDLFATHYFNRFHFELKNNTISITEFNTEKTGKISRQKIGNKYVSQLIIGEKVIMSVSSLEINDVIPEETGSIVYYESDNTIEAKILGSEEINYEGRKESELMYEIFSSSINSSITMEENFNLLADNFSKGKNIEGMFGKGDTAYVLTGIRFNEAKKPEIGTLILKNKDNTYELKSFFKGKIFEEKKNIELKNIKQEIEILAASFQKKLNEDFK